MINRLIYDKKKTESQMSVLYGILDAQNNDVVIVNRKCDIIYMNYAARNHFPETSAYLGCNGSCAESIPGLCKNCPNKTIGIINRADNVEVTDKNGVYYSAAYSAIRWVDDSLCTAIFLHNVNENRAKQEKLYNLAYIDQLTGIANRTKLREDMEEMCDGIAASDLTGAMAILDLDHFKDINDNYGHNVGDVILKRLTYDLDSDENFRGRLYRLGGDEFVLLFRDSRNRFHSLTECRNFYHGLLMNALQSYTLPFMDVRCTISIGVSFFPWQGHGFSDILRKADIALYRAKANGRNQICYYEDAFDSAYKFREIYYNIQHIWDRESAGVGM
jgi:diguanylate cyclase (GGDEF)-like protein